MEMFSYIPTSCADGEPESSPVTALNVAQPGAEVMLNVSASASASLALGVKL